MQHFKIKRNRKSKTKGEVNELVQPEPIANKEQVDVPRKKVIRKKNT